MGKQEYGSCYICKGEVTQEQVDANEVVLMNTPLRVPERVTSFIHTRHPGVNEEYNNQLGLKVKKVA